MKPCRVTQRGLFFQINYKESFFDEKTHSGTVLKFDGELYELLKNPVADETFKLMYQVKDCGFLQFREHFRPLLEKKQNGRSVEDKKLNHIF